MKVLQSALIWGVLANSSLHAQDSPKTEKPINEPTVNQTETKSTSKCIITNEDVIRATKELITSADTEGENTASYVFQLMGWLYDSQNSSIEKLNLEFDGIKAIYKGHDKEIETLRQAVLNFRKQDNASTQNMLGDKIIRNCAMELAKNSNFDVDKCLKLIEAIANDDLTKIEKILEGINGRCKTRFDSKVTVYTAQKLRLASNPIP